MGYSVSWIAVRGVEREEVFQVLRLSGTGEYQDIPDWPLQGSLLVGGWYLVFANRCDFAGNAPLAKLSRRSELVTCFAEEHVMFSSASGWSHGKCLWSIEHDAQQGLEHLVAEGELPAQFEAIRREQFTKQAEEGGADYVFETPVRVVQALCGVRYDEDFPFATRQAFERLTIRKRWWQFWR